ncbi:MAG: hypothetical protein ACMUIM_11610, partial [bacterium]
GPLAHLSWGEEAGSRHLFPLMYSNRRTGTFVSPFAVKWRSGIDTTTYTIPFTLSWMSKSEKRNDLWLAGPLAHLSWGEEPGSRHLFPLFYRNPSRKTFVSPLFVTWKKGIKTHRLSPPLLSGYSTDGKKEEINILFGLFREEWGGGKRSGHLAPIYYYEGEESFYTPVLGWNREKRNGFVYPLTPLVGMHTGDNSGGWLFPLFSHKKARETGNYKGRFLWGTYRKSDWYARSRFLPFYDYKKKGARDSTSRRGGQYTDYSKDFWMLPTFWYRNRLILSSKDRRYSREHGFAPLWSFSRKEFEFPENRELHAEGSILWLLYKYKRDVKLCATKTKEDTDYIRARILWKLWDYERDHDEVRVDIFPGITYDREKDGSKEVTFLYRFFRYRSGKDKKLNLLFVPILR